MRTDRQRHNREFENLRAVKVIARTPSFRYHRRVFHFEIVVFQDSLGEDVYCLCTKWSRKRLFVETSSNSEKVHGMLLARMKFWRAALAA